MSFPMSSIDGMRNDSSGTLWCCHIIGPDDVIPAPDEATAKAWAGRFNAFVSKQFDEPLAKAEAAPWPWDAEAHAEGPADEYAWLVA